MSNVPVGKSTAILRDDRRAHNVGAGAKIFLTGDAFVDHPLSKEDHD